MVRRVLATALVASVLVLSGRGSNDRPEPVAMASPSNAAAVTVVDAFQGAPDGAALTAPLIQGKDGELYGATESGGAANLGTIFLITPDGARSVLYSFTGADGAAPSGLVQAADGKLYGTTRSGGASGHGTVFRITPDGVLTTLHAFDGNDGAHPSGQIIQATDGHFYGTTNSGATARAGTIFKMTPEGSVTTLHVFGGGADGAHPEAALLQAADGHFYGTTAVGGRDGRGSVFRMTRDGVVTVLHSFAGADGERPTASLIEGPSGELYGTTELGGKFGYGTIFRISPGGGFSAMHAFNAVDGATPSGALAQTADGRMFGTTTSGGEFGSGTVFELKEDGSVVVMHAFSGGSDGGDPHSSVIQGLDGKLYGTTRHGGGPTASGVVFVMSVLGVTVTSPNGGERLYTGTPHMLTWDATEGTQSIDHFDVEYSVDGGITWNAVFGCTGVSGTARSCVWSAPGPVTTKGKIRVTATDTGGSSVSDASNGVFRISTGTASVTVSSPNTASTNWGVGSRQQIAWKHNVSIKATFTVELTRDAGANWEVLGTAVPAATATTGVLNWQVTAPTTTEALVRVTFENAPSASDVSNANFKIASAFVTIVMPKASANWGYTTNQLTKWTTNLGAGDTVNVLLSTDGGSTFPTTLASGGVATAKQAAIVTPELSSPTTTAKVRVVWSNPPSGFSAAANSPNFKIQPPFVTITTPNGGESWGDGTTQTIAWSNNLGALENVAIELSQDGGSTYPVVIRSSTPSDGTERVTVMSAWTTSSARIRVTWAEGPSVADASNGNFTIGMPPFITVTSPNGGESWTVGTMQTISWSDNLPSLQNVKIELSKDGGATYPITVLSSTPADGSQQVTVASDWVSTTARIRITSVSNSSVTDASNANFTIQAAGSSPDVSIVDFSFMPSTLTITTGDTVTWTNKGGAPHTTTSDTIGVWDSGSLGPGGTFSHTFTTSGEYPYHCQIHLGMTGTIVVEP